MSRSIDSSWNSHKSEGQNPDWFSDGKLFSLRYLDIDLKRKLLKIFHIVES